MFLRLNQFLEASKHRLAIFITAYVVVFGSLAAFGYYFLNTTTQLHAIKRGPLSHGFMTDMAYYDLPRLTVSMSNGDGGGGDKGPRIRLDISLEVARKDVDIVEGYEPHITEELGDFIRTLHTEQVSNSESMLWIHDEMLKRINSSGVPVPVHDILFRELLIM